MKSPVVALISALVGILATILPAAMWVGRLQERVNHLETQVQSCADKDVQAAHDSWIRGWSEELNYRLRRLEEKR
jgi:hypothetical protein